MKAKTRFGLLIPVGLLLAVVLVGALSSAPAAVASEPTVTLTTDKDTYEKGQTIRISGNVRDAENKPVASGAATIKLSSGTWSQTFTTPITNGSYSYDYRISFGNPPLTGTATWRVKVTADNLGTRSKNITVIIPASVRYLVEIRSPKENFSYARGENVTITAKVTEGGSPIENAAVFSNTPKGENIPMSAAGDGTYEGNPYPLKWSDPTGDWSISVEATKTVNNTFRAGGWWINVKIAPAVLGVKLISPIRGRFEIGESVEVRVKVTYPSGELVENAVVQVTTPTGESRTLEREDLGVYRTTCALGAQDPETWNLTVTASDSYLNSGRSESKVIYIARPVVPGFLAKYWWAVLSAILAAGIASAYVSKGKILTAKLEDVRREMKEIPRLKREAAIKYFREGTTSRSVYDGLIKRYDARMDELKRKEVALKAKLKKKAKEK